jgi:hypothetical protein
MTASRDSKDKPKKERPRLKKQTLRDLTPNRPAEYVRGGVARLGRDGGNCTAQESGCASE